MGISQSCWFRLSDRRFVTDSRPDCETRRQKGSANAISDIRFERRIDTFDRSTQHGDIYKVPTAFHLSLRPVCPSKIRHLAEST